MLPDDLLPGVGAEPMPMRETLRAGGAAMVIVLGLITIAEGLERAAGGVLAPDIQDTLNMSDTTLIGISALRRRRARARRGAAGVARRPDVARAHRVDRDDRVGGRHRAERAGREPVPALLQPRRHRVRAGLLGAGVRVVAHRHVPDPGPGARVRAVLDGAADRVCSSVRSSPGAIADAAGGTEGWRWTYVILAIPPVLLVDRSRSRCCASPHAAATSRSSCSARCSTPSDDAYRAAGVDVDRVRAAEEDQDLLLTSAPASGCSGSRWSRCRCSSACCSRTRYGYSAYTRGWMLSLTALASLAAIPIAGLTYDRLFRRDPRARRAARGRVHHRVRRLSCSSRCGCRNRRCC